MLVPYATVVVKIYAKWFVDRPRVRVGKDTCLGRTAGHAKVSMSLNIQIVINGGKRNRYSRHFM